MSLDERQATRRTGRSAGSTWRTSSGAAAAAPVPDGHRLTTSEIGEEIEVDTRMVFTLLNQAAAQLREEQGGLVVA